MTVSGEMSGFSSAVRAALRDGADIEETVYRLAVAYRMPVEEARQRFQALCRRYETASWKVVARHLLLGVDEKKFRWVWGMDGHLEMAGVEGDS